MKRFNPADYEERQLEDFSKYVFGMPYQPLKDVMNNRKDVRNNAGNKGAGGNERNNWRRNNINTGSTCR